MSSSQLSNFFKKFRASCRNSQLVTYIFHHICKPFGLTMQITCLASLWKLPRWKADPVLRVWGLMRYDKSFEISCLKAWPNLFCFFHGLQFRDQNRAFHISDGIYITHILNILPMLHILGITYLYIYMSIAVCSSGPLMKLRNNLSRQYKMQEFNMGHI